MLAVLLLNRMRARRKSERKKLRKSSQKQEEIQVSEQLVDYCRTCLISTNLVDIFYSEETARKRSEDLKTVTGIEIELNDGLSQKMCTKCMETLNLALHFRIISAKNDIKQRKLFQNLNENFQMDAEQIAYLEDYEYVENDIADENFSTENQDLDQDIEFVEDIVDQDFLEEDTNSEVYQEQSPKNPERPNPNNAVQILDMVYKCQFCYKEFNKRATYKMHVRSHSSDNVCDECGKLCYYRSQLATHKRAAHGMQRVHFCAHCDYSSATKAALVTHERRHADSREFVCERCGASFLSRGGLIQHLPIHNEEANFVIHERRHADSREFVCERCGASFLSRGGLIQHLPIHNEEANFECDICHKREKSKRLLQHHYHKVHREKRLRYLCPVCQSIFKSITGVRYHLTKAHDVPREDQPSIQRFQISAEENTPDSTEG